MKTAIIIQAGGTGTRLWPLSTNKSPKQFAGIINEKSLLRNTFDRVQQIAEIQDIFVSTSVKFEQNVLKEIPELSSKNIILEPKKMDTAPSLALTTFKLHELGYTTAISIACDHNILDVQKFLKTLQNAAATNQKYPNQLILVGMNPSFPSTGYGYIEMGEPKDRINEEIIFTVNSFKEKPDLKTAEKFVEDWKYLWNAGYFIYNPEFLLQKFAEHSPQTYNALKDTFKLDPKSPEFETAYTSCEAISVDYAIVEKLKDILVLPASVGWSDIGSWQAVHEILVDHDTRKNAFTGNVLEKDTKGSLVHSTNPNKLIALLGLKNIVVIDTGDVLLVADMNKCQDVKKLVEQAPDALK
jgi:mannose-1-phosphate guanylyltransferase